jgi:hypothetical protein
LTTTDPDRLYWDEIVRRGMAARKKSDDSSWELGECASEVETRYGEGDLQKYADAIGVNYDTLRDYRYVVGRFVERPTNLPFGVLRALARIETDEDRQYWMGRAVMEHWTVSRARREIAQMLDGPKVPEPSARKQPAMNGHTDRATEMFRNIAEGFAALREEAGEQEPEVVARSLTEESRRAAERAIHNASEFVDYWSSILTLEVGGDND